MPDCRMQVALSAANPTSGRDAATAVTIDPASILLAEFDVTFLEERPHPLPGIRAGLGQRRSQ